MENYYDNQWSFNSLSERSEISSSAGSVIQTINGAE